MHRMQYQITVFILLATLLTGCNSTQTPVVIKASVTPAEKQPDAQEVAPTSPTPPAPISSVTPVYSSVELENVALVYNLPPAILNNPTGLYASPNRTETVIGVQLAAGAVVYVMGRNATGTHLRVVWNTGVGWIPTSFTDYNAAREKMDALPIFTREPPACAVPLATQFSLSNEWVNDDSQRQRIAVVIDLFRSRYGSFPASTLALAVNGKEIESSKRQIIERGQFSLKDVVFTLPGYILPGDTISYILHTSSDEPLAFLATIFSIPDNCVWKTD